jgi:transketolase C-terminal domain/subunit
MKDHRGNPGCYLLQPSDAYAAYALTEVMAEYEGFCYMRTLRPDVEFLYNDQTVFNLGGMEVLNEGRDVLIVASGYMVHEANRALDALDKAGVNATLVDLYSLPFDTEQAARPRPRERRVRAHARGQLRRLDRLRGRRRPDRRRWRVHADAALRPSHPQVHPHG